MTERAKKLSVDENAKIMGQVSETIKKIESQTWAEPVGKALGVTANICNGLGTWLPGLCILGGALRMGSSLLNPKASLADLKRAQNGIETSIPGPELVTDLEKIKADIQSCATDISRDVKKIEKELTETKTIIERTYNLVMDIRFREGLEKIEAAFENFIRGSYNLEENMTSLQNYLFEHQTTAIASLKPNKVFEYLKEVERMKNPEMCRQIYQYIFIVRAKYLQMCIAYYASKNDVHRIATEYECFNEDVYKLHEMLQGDLKLKQALSQISFVESIKNTDDKTEVHAITSITHSMPRHRDEDQRPKHCSKYSIFILVYILYLTPY